MGSGSTITGMMTSLAVGGGSDSVSLLSPVASISVGIGCSLIGPFTSGCTEVSLFSFSFGGGADSVSWVFVD